MPELKSGLMWRMEARKPSEAVKEIVAARERFMERLGARPTMIYSGFNASTMLEKAFRARMFPLEEEDSLPTPLVKVDQLGTWDILITGDEPKGVQP